MKRFAFALLFIALPAVCAAQDAQTPARAKLSDQRICAEQAQKRFNEYVQYLPKQGKDSILVSVNHFDPKLNVCYVALSNSFPDGGSFGRIISVSDAFEGTLLASFINGVECSVAEEVCHSDHEFRVLVRQKFGISLFGAK